MHIHMHVHVHNILLQMHMPCKFICVYNYNIYIYICIYTYKLPSFTNYYIFNMIWFVMIWYDVICVNMILCCICLNCKHPAWFYHDRWLKRLTAPKWPNMSSSGTWIMRQTLITAKHGDFGDQKWWHKQQWPINSEYICWKLGDTARR